MHIIYSLNIYLSAKNVFFLVLLVEDNNSSSNNNKIIIMIMKYCTPKRKVYLLIICLNYFTQKQWGRRRVGWAKKTLICFCAPRAVRLLISFHPMPHMIDSIWFIMFSPRFSFHFLLISCPSSHSWQRRTAKVVSTWIFELHLTLLLDLTICSYSEGIKIFLVTVPPWSWTKRYVDKGWTLIF